MKAEQLAVAPEDTQKVFREVAERSARIIGEFAQRHVANSISAAVSDELGIAKNAREEKAASRKHKTAEEFAKEAAHHAEMAKLYAQHVLKEQPTLQIQGLGSKRKAQDVQPVLHKPTT